MRSPLYRDAVIRFLPGYIPLFLALTCAHNPESSGSVPVYDHPTEDTGATSYAPSGQIPVSPAPPVQQPVYVQFPAVPSGGQVGPVGVVVSVDGEQLSIVNDALDDAFQQRPRIVRVLQGASVTLQLSGVRNRGIGSCKWRLKAKATQPDGRLIFLDTKEYSKDLIWSGVAGECEKMIRQSVGWALDRLLGQLGSGGGGIISPIPVTNLASSLGPRSDITPQPGVMNRAQSVALVIGIEKYRRNLPDAIGAASDANVFAAFAEQSFGLPRNNIRVLINADATRSSLDAEFSEWLPRNVSRDSDVFIYFAGHGAPDAQTGERFLVPWDADPAFIETQGMGLPKLLSRLAKLNAAHIYVFLDACFTGAGGRSVVPTGTRPLVMLRKWPKPEAVGRLLVLAASGPNETTGISRSGHGLFSYYLFRGLNGEADSNRDREVSFSELAAYAGEQVANEARRENRDQHPRVIGTENPGHGAILTRHASR